MGWIILGILGIVILLPVLIFLVAWFVLAKNNLFFTFVEEGTAKAVMKAGEFERIIFRWKAHFMDEEDNIWDEEDWEVSLTEEGARVRKEETEEKVKEKKIKGRIFGGLFWVGWWPFKKIHTYSLRWTDFRQAEETGKTVFKLQFHDEKDRNFVMLKPAVYGIEVKDVETRPPERIAVTVQIPVTMRVINPRKFLFIAPPTPLEDVLVKMSALMRQQISMSIIDELITLQGQAEKIWEGWEIEEEEVKKILGIEKVPGIKEEKLIVDTLPKWGLKVAEKGVEIKTIEPPPDLQKAMAEKRKQDMLAEARAAEIMGSIVSSEAVARGKSKDEIQKEIDQNPLRQTEVWKEVWEIGKEFTLKKLAMESGSYIYGEFPQGTSLEGLMTLLKRMPMSGESPAAEVKGEEKPSWPALEEERRKSEERRKKKD